MQQQERKKYLKLDEEAWQKVRTFVDAYFQQQERASNATYKILFTAISERFSWHFLNNSFLGPRDTRVVKLLTIVCPFDTDI
jgi:hypothetical protein